MDCPTCSRPLTRTTYENVQVMQCEECFGYLVARRRLTLIKSTREVGPEALHEEARTVPKTMPRSAGHWKELVDACKGGKPPVSNFAYAGPLTEVVLLGNLAMRAPGRRIQWDGLRKKSTNIPELNPFVHKEYRQGWSL